MVQTAKNKRPLISVIMPVLNAEATIAEAVKSILQQTYPDLELILIMDGSSDKSIDIIRSFRDKRIKIISLKYHRGISIALNTGIQHAQGTYIARMDGDDIAYPERLASQIRYMQTHKDCVVLGSRVITIDAQGKQIRSPQREKKQLIHSTVLIRKKMFKLYGMYDSNLDGAEDYDLWLRFAHKGSIYILPEVLLKYRRTKNAVSYQNVSRVYRALLKAKLKAVLEYGYPWWFLISAIKPAIIFLLPNSIKQKIYDYYYGIV